jgi:hypothetical protein
LQDHPSQEAKDIDDHRITYPPSAYHQGQPQVRLPRLGLGHLLSQQQPLPDLHLFSLEAIRKDQAFGQLPVDRYDPLVDPLPDRRVDPARQIHVTLEGLGQPPEEILPAAGGEDLLLDAQQALPPFGTGAEDLLEGLGLPPGLLQRSHHRPRDPFMFRDEIQLAGVDQTLRERLFQKVQRLQSRRRQLRESFAQEGTGRPERSDQRGRGHALSAPFLPETGDRLGVRLASQGADDELLQRPGDLRDGTGRGHPAQVVHHMTPQRLAELLLQGLAQSPQLIGKPPSTLRPDFHVASRPE